MHSKPNYEILEVEIDPVDSTENINYYEKEVDHVFKVEKMSNTRVKLIPLHRGTTKLYAETESGLIVTCNVNVSD